MRVKFIIIPLFILAVIAVWGFTKLTETTLSNKNEPTKVLYTWCAPINSTPDSVANGGGVASQVTYTIGSNKLLRIKYGTPFDNTKKISFVVNVTSSSGGYLQMFGKSTAGIVYTMTSCTSLPLSGHTLTSVTNVPYNTAEVWLEFSATSSGGISADVKRNAQ